MSTMESTNLTIETMKKMFAEEKRFDGRKMDEFRDFEIEYDVSNKAEGSARVKLGKTDVIVGIKLAPGEPYPDSPDKGNLTVSADLLPLASPRFEMGPPEFPAIELPRLVDRAVRESGMIDLSKLVMKEGELVWTVFIDIYPINDDGNLIDASCLAVIAALKKTKIPELGKDNKVNYEKESKKKLPVSEETAPISISFFKLGSSIILDPTREEEEACDGRITFGLSKWKGQYMVNSCQKSQRATLSAEEVEKMMEMLPKKFDKLNERLKKFL